MSDNERKYTPDELLTVAASPNIAEHLEPEELHQIGKDVINDYEDDYGRMSDKIEQWKEILDLTMQKGEEKNFPWPGAANIKYPLITSACIRFAARIYPEIVQSGRVARVKAEGNDAEGNKEERSTRVEAHLNYQLTEEVENWEPDMDVLLTRLPMYGCYYKKLYFSSVYNRPVVENCEPTKVIISDPTLPLEEQERISHIIHIRKNDVVSKIRSGLFLDIDLPCFDRSEQDDDEGDVEDEEFIEQHCWLDLDEDGYKEPYVVTAHRETQTVFRIVSRYTEDDVQTKNIDGEEVIIHISGFTHFVDYVFMNAFDDTTTGYGYGELLTPINEEINTVTNQLLDAGTLANVNGGFVSRGVRMESGPFRLSMGEWLPVETRGGSLKDNLVPLPAQGPSQALMQLLELMLNTADNLAASNYVDPGQIPANTPATTTLAVIEEAMKVYSSVHKRVYASIKKEVRKIFKLNKMFGDPEKYARFQDDPNADMFVDYDFEDLDIFPVAAPEVSSDMQRLVKAQGLVAMLDSPGAMSSGLNPRAVMQNYLEATHQPNIDEILPEPPPVDEGPSLEEQMLQMQAQLEQQKIEIDAYKAETDRMSKEAKAMKDMAEAEAAEEGQQLQKYQQGVQDLKDIAKLEQAQEALDMQREQQAVQAQQTTTS